MRDSLSSLSTNELKKLVIVFLLTDGYVSWRGTRNQVQLRFYNKDIELHELFAEVMFLAFGARPVSFFIPQMRVQMTVFEFSKNSDVVKELYSLCPEFRTNKIYVETPTIQPILEGSCQLQRFAFRVAMSTDGCISKTKRGFRLRLGCSHPKLTEEWKLLAKTIGVEMNITRDKNTWSGVQGINTDKLENARNFLKIGGFVPGTKAHRSKLFSSKEKNEILSLCLG